MDPKEEVDKFTLDKPLPLTSRLIHDNILIIRKILLMFRRSKSKDGWFAHK